MYIEQFKLKDLPFRLSPDPQFLYLSKHHARAKAYMESTIWFTDGFVVITGEIGAGKTTLIETFLHELDKDVVVAQINQTQVTATEFLQAVLVQFGFTPFKMKKAELIATLNSFLIEQYSAGRKVLLVVDEAQNLASKVLEELRLLSGVETTKEKVLRIILCGQPELNEKLDSAELTQLAQRIRLRFHLTPLSASDMHAYVLHRLEVAGSGGRKIFHDEVFPLLFRYTGGVPRLVNSLCETAMMSAFNDDRDFVTVDDVLGAIEELRWVEYAKRAGSQDAATTGSFGVDSTGTQAGPALYVGTRGEDVVLARIIVAKDGETVGELPLRLGRLVVGRTSDNDLQIDSRFVSRHHCQIITTREGCLIEDLNSTNGIAIKSKRIRHRNLNDGDVISIGRHELLYVDDRTRQADATGSNATLAGKPPEPVAGG